jgi:dihydrofolate reductase
MQELLVDFITSLDGYGSAEGWPGWWGLQGPEYLRWLDEQPERDYTLLMGAKTYRLFSKMYEQTLGKDENASVDALTNAAKVVFSSTLQSPLSWANTRLVTENAIEAVRKMKQEGNRPMSTIGSVSLCRSLLKAGLVDRFRVVVFPVITGSTGSDRIYDGYPDVALDMITSRTFDGRLQLLEYVPRVLSAPPNS